MRQSIIRVAVAVITLSALCYSAPAGLEYTDRHKAEIAAK